MYVYAIKPQCCFAFWNVALIFCICHFHNTQLLKTSIFSPGKELNGDTPWLRDFWVIHPQGWSREHLLLSALACTVSCTWGIRESEGTSGLGSGEGALPAQSDTPCVEVSPGWSVRCYRITAMSCHRSQRISFRSSRTEGCKRALSVFIDFLDLPTQVKSIILLRCQSISLLWEF